MFRLVPSPKPISAVCPQLSLEKLSMSHPTGPRRSKMSRDTLGKDVTRPALPKAFWRDYFEMGFTDHHENSKKYLSSIGFSTYGKDLLKWFKNVKIIEKLFFVIFISPTPQSVEIAKNKSLKSVLGLRVSHKKCPDQGWTSQRLQISVPGTLRPRDGTLGRRTPVRKTL